MTTGRGVLARLAATVAVGGGFLVASVAPAAAANSVTITSPAAEGAVISDPTQVGLAGQASADGYICQIDLKVTPSSGQAAANPPSTTIDLHNQPQHNTTFSWTPSFPANGKYQYDVVVHAYSDPLCGFSPTSVPASRTFGLALPPAPPVGVTATANPDRTVKVAWKANTEPDLVGYDVFRVLKGKTCPTPVASDRITSTTTLSYTDALPSSAPGGDYCYSVEATRTGATSSTTVSSAPSSPAQATVAAPPTTASGGSSAGGGSAGAGGGTGGGGGTTQPGSSGFTVLGGPADASNPGAAGPAGGGAGGAPAGGSRGLDLGFSALVARAKEAAGAPGRPAQAAEPDGGFLPTLPFTKRSDQAGGGESVANDSSADLLGGSDNSQKIRVAGAIAAGLLALVVGGHLLLLRREVNRTPVLEPMEPSAGAAGASG